MSLAIDVPHFQNVVDHGNSWSNGLGGQVKNETEVKSIGLHPKIPLNVPHDEWAQALVDLGNMALACPSTTRVSKLTKGNKATRRCFLLQKFWTYNDNSYRYYTPPPGTFPQQTDGAGMVWELRNIFSFWYSHSSGKLFFSKLFCACLGCLCNGLCAHREFVALWKECWFTGAAEPPADGESKSHPGSDSGSPPRFVPIWGLEYHLELPRIVRRPGG